MNVAGSSENVVDSVNVLPLFTGTTLLNDDPLKDLIEEGQAEYSFSEELLAIPQKRYLVQENQFPDQSMYVLDKQISSLKESLGRLKFYLSDIEDLLPQ